MNDCGEDFEGGRLEPASLAALPILRPGSGLAGAAAPIGLALDFVDGEFVVEVACAGEEPPLVLGPYADEEVVAIWRRMAAASGLPLLLRGADGLLQQPYPQLGRLLVGERCERRRLKILSGRRPRFLTKRRATSLPRRPRIHRETEIAAGGGR